MNDGSLIILCKTGWACTNEATIMVQQEVERNPDGSLYSKRTNVIRAMFIHYMKGAISEGDILDVVFKYNHDDIKKSYQTRVIGLTSEMAILAIVKETNNQKEIIKQIKGGN